MFLFQSYLKRSVTPLSVLQLFYCTMNRWLCHVGIAVNGDFD